MAAKLKQIGFKDIKCDFNHQNISSENVEAFRRKYNKETHVLFNSLYELYRSATDENQNLTMDKFKIYDLQNDIINDITFNEKLIRSLTDIVSENNVPKRELKVTEINLSPNILVKEVEQNMALHQLMPTHVDYNLVVKNKEDVTEMFREKSVVWDIKDELQLKSSDLIILRDSQEIWELSLENLVKQLKTCVNGNGFLLTLFRCQWTEPELALNSLLKGQKIINNSDLENRIQEFMKTAEKLGLHLICSKSDSIANKGSTLQKN